VMQACWEASLSIGEIWRQALDKRLTAEGVEVPTLARNWRTTLADHRAGRPPAPSAPSRTSPNKGFPAHRRPGPDTPPWCRNG